MKPRILLADDDRLILQAWEMVLREKYDLLTTTSIQVAKNLVLKNDLDLAIVDLNFEGQDEDGLTLIDLIFRERPQTSVIVLSGDNSTSRVSDAMRRPIVDFIVKGGDIEERLDLAVERAIQQRRSQLALRKQFETRSPEMKKMLNLLERIAKSENQSSILIIGEPGTGKEHTARHIGVATKKTVVTTNMANHRAELADSALFGHVRGAFTGADSTRAGLIEQADNGIFFLDEVGETPLEVQAKLLRVFQEKEFHAVGSTVMKKVNVRFIAATNRDLSAMANKGAFRKDLLERLSTWTLRIPPLRERPEDIAFLTNEFLNSFTKGGRPFRIEPEGLDELLDYQWPGNIRELRNVIERITTVWDTRVLDREAARFGIYQGQNSITNEPTKSAPAQNLSREDYITALRESKGNRTRAAQLLSVTPRTLFRKLRQLNLDESPGTPGRPRSETEIA